MGVPSLFYYKCSCMNPVSPLKDATRVFGFPATLIPQLTTNIFLTVYLFYLLQVNHCFRELHMCLDVTLSN